MDIRYSEGDYKVGDKVCLSLDSDIIGLVTGIAFRGNGNFLYLVTTINGATPTEYWLRDFEIKKAK